MKQTIPLIPETRRYYKSKIVQIKEQNDANSEKYKNSKRKIRH